MDLDLSTNGASIKENIIKLHNGKISWMILGYSENNTLSVIETGDNSLEDMFDEFQGSEIMYGFATVIDPNTKLKKNIYIHWQGAGSKQGMKTKSVQHSNVIRELCKPIHVTLNARDTQDLDLNEVMQKVAAASGANYSVHSEKQQIFETKPAVKSQGNTASTAREERQKELASLGGVRKEFSSNQKTTSPKINSVKPNIKPSLSSKSTFSKTGSNYEKINPEKEFQSLNINQKTTFETPAKVQSENNTAEKAREERQKELSKLANRTYIDEPFQQVGTNYTKINPMAEIQQLKKQCVLTDTEIPTNPPSSNFTRCVPKDEIIKLKRESVNNDDDTRFSPNSSYKKIDPYSEIQELRKNHKFTDSEERVSPSSNYKKINPTEEIKNLKSQNEFTFREPYPVASSYKKINPKEELMAVKMNSEPSRSTDVTVTSSYKEINSTEKLMSVKTNSVPPQNFEEKKPIQRIDSTNEQKSARSTFENMHKSKEDSYKRISNEYKSLSVNIVKSVETSQISSENKIHIEKKESNSVSHHTIEIRSVSSNKVENFKKLKNAVAIYDYEANDSDEIEFVVDDIIKDIDEIDEGWWIGCNKTGKRGMFPSNYVEIIVSEDQSVAKHDDNPTLSQENPGNFLTVIAIYDYNAAQDDELSFKEGEYIYNVNQFDEGWWEGETKSGAKGMFPSNYVRIP